MGDLEIFPTASGSWPGDTAVPHLSDRELEIMQMLWDNGLMLAGEIAENKLREQDQLRNTTYTYLTSLIKKGAIRRKEPGYMCKATLAKEDVQWRETQRFVEKYFEGSFASLQEMITARSQSRDGC